MNTDPQTGVVTEESVTAICVQDIDDQCVLQITLIHAVCCALHRLASLVVHRIGLYLYFNVFFIKKNDIVYTYNIKMRFKIRIIHFKAIQALFKYVEYSLRHTVNEPSASDAH